MKIHGEKPPRILLVEDDESIRLTLEEFLTDEGYVVTTANNGLQAMNQLQDIEFQPDLILMDLFMPVLNGFEFVEFYSNSIELKHSKAPLVVMSASGGKVKSIFNNIDAYLKKPLNVDELLEVVRKYTLPKNVH